MARPFFLFAPGAGAPSSHPWMQRWRERLSTIGDVEAFDYPYMQQRRGRPDPLTQLIAAHRQALVETRRDRPAVLIGKSMGGRIGCHVSLEEKVEAIVCFGYPLCGGGDQSKLRDKVLLALQTPVLFVQGTRDSLCPLELLKRIRAEMTAPTSLHIVEGGDHSLLVGKRQLAAARETQEEVDQRILEAIAKFLIATGDKTPSPQAQL